MNMNRKELEVWFSRCASVDWKDMKQSVQFNKVYENKTVEKIYTEAGRLAVALGNMGLSDLPDKEKVEMIKEQLPTLENLLTQAKKDTAIMSETFFVKIIKLAEETAKNVEELRKMIKS